jgi:uncharacterized membrane protein YidH (DUF202 family)
MKKFLVGAIFLTLSYADIAWAATPLDNTLNTIKSLANTVIPLFITLAVVFFFWGLVKFVANADDEEAKKKAKNLMIWGMVAVFVMVSFWGLIGYIQQSAGLSGKINIVQAPSSGEFNSMLPQ